MNLENRQKITARILELMGEFCIFGTMHAWGFYGNKEGFHFSMYPIKLMHGEDQEIAQIDELIDELDPASRASFLDFCIKRSDNYEAWGDIDDDFFKIIAMEVFENVGTEEDVNFLNTILGNKVL